MKFICLLALLFASCAPNSEVTTEQIQKWKQEIVQAEADFANHVKESGITSGFHQFAADNGVIMRNDSVITTKAGIKNFYENSRFIYKSLDWKPDFVDVSKSGDMAYTYGKYTFSGTLPNGQELSGSGVFHTVWKRQNDGNWKYVWD